MTNFDKLLEDTESKELIIDYIAGQFCIDKVKIIINRHVNCDNCGFYKEKTDCDFTVSEWLKEEYKGKEEGGSEK